MKASYKDIKNLIKDAPKWYDENGVPRYCEHHPEACPDIYSNEVILLEIACQNCHQHFKVQMSHNEIAKHLYQKMSLSEAIKKEVIHYGDPPVHVCAGDTMNCYDLKVVEFWERCNSFEWIRNKDLEIEIEQDWRI